MSTIKAILLDVGGVILQIDWSRPLEFAGVRDPRRRHELIERFHGWKHFHLYERGKISSADFFAGFNELLGMERPIEFWQDAWRSLIVGELPEVNMIFDQFSGHIPVYAVSNTNEDHYNFQFKKYPVLQRFDRFFTSFELHERKPDAEFFLKIFAETGLHAGEVLFVDDTAENVEAARRVGIRSLQSVNSVRETVDFLLNALSTSSGSSVIS